MSSPKPSLQERSLNHQLVLDEDEYTAALSKIIARDFFPSLVHLDATNDYLDALHSQDPHLISASVLRLEEISATPLNSTKRRVPYQTPSQTPFGGGPSQTPLRTPRGEPPNKRPKYDTGLSLDAFQARYTSEDNSSFTQILDEENRTRKEKWGWAWEAQRRMEAQQERLVEQREKMLIEAPPVLGVREKFMIETPTPAGLLTDGTETDKEGAKEIGEDTGKELISLGNEEEPEGEQVDVMAPQKDTRSAGVDGWTFKARNSLMFPPDADVSPYHQPLSSDSSHPKVIKYGNTRLPEHEHSVSTPRSSAPPSPTQSRINAAITGTPYHPGLPTAKGFPLVPTLPSPTPSELGPAAMKQLMTWGTLDATPRVISQSEDRVPTPSTPFHLPEISSREAISHRLSNNASKSLRAKAGLLGLGQHGRPPGISVPTRKGDMAPPSWTPRRSEAAGNLTPAARRLLERSTMGAAAVKRAEAIERVADWKGRAGKERELDRVRWTPTPSPVSRR